MMRSRLALSLAAALPWLGACASTQPAALEEARLAYEEAAADPDVQRHGAVALHEAEQALERAEDAWRQDDDELRQIEHLAYVADRRVAIAQEVALHGKLEERAEMLGKERSRVRLRARTAEAEAAASLAARESERAQALEDELRELRVEETERGRVMTLGDVLFETDRADLEPGAEVVLDRVAVLLNEHPERRVAVEGHTDAVGSEAYNERLSRERARSVADYLERRGVDPQRITVAGYGESRPVVPNTSRSSRQHNRRVEIVLESGAR